MNLNYAANTKKNIKVSIAIAKVTINNISIAKIINF